MRLSVIIPAYNEEKRITATILDADAYLKDNSYDYEIIAVVNGSSDKTYSILEELKNSGISSLITVNLSQGGKGNAVKRGILDYASGDLILFMDADNATPISQIENFTPYILRGDNVIIGSRYVLGSHVEKKQSGVRIALSRLGNALIRLLILPGIKDTQVGFKAFKRQAAIDIFPSVSVSGWAFDMEVLAIAKTRGYMIEEVGVRWTEYGNSHLKINAYIESLRDLLKIKLNLIRHQYENKNKFYLRYIRARDALRKQKAAI